jgi:hypothetical protein
MSMALIYSFNVPYNVDCDHVKSPNCGERIVEREKKSTQEPYQGGGGEGGAAAQPDMKMRQVWTQGEHLNGLVRYKLIFSCLGCYSIVSPVKKNISY